MNRAASLQVCLRGADFPLSLSFCMQHAAESGVDHQHHTVYGMLQYRGFDINTLLFSEL